MRSPYGECHRNSETQFYVYVRWRQNSTGIDMEQNRVTVTLRIRDGCFRAEGKCRTFGLYCSHLANEERSDSSLSMSSTWHRGRFFFSDSMQRRRQNRPTDVRLDAWHAHRRTPFRAAVVALGIDLCADLLTYILQ